MVESTVPVSQLIQNPEERQRIIKRFHNDATIKMYHSLIQRVLVFAKPNIVFKVCPEVDFKYSIDEESQKVVDHWEGQLKEYIDREYKELTTWRLL